MLGAVARIQTLDRIPVRDPRDIFERKKAADAHDRLIILQRRPH
jgi:hypothetical protein